MKEQNFLFLLLNFLSFEYHQIRKINNFKKLILGTITAYYNNSFPMRRIFQLLK